jgi:hypothetical protein
MIDMDATALGGIRERDELPDRGRLHACTFLGNFRHNYYYYLIDIQILEFLAVKLQIYKIFVRVQGGGEEFFEGTMMR